MKVRELMDGLYEGQRFLAEARESEIEGGTITAISYSYLDVEYAISDDALAIHIYSGNSAFSGDREEVRCGRLEGWEIRWYRRDIGVVSGEDFMPEDLRAWLFEHTRPEADVVAS